MRPIPRPALDPSVYGEIDIDEPLTLEDEDAIREQCIGLGCRPLPSLERRKQERPTDWKTEPQ